ncbi:MAG: hypothetical protein AB1597_08470 [Chloroflexota bacterium]
MELDEKIQQALKATTVVRPPKQTLATFGTTNINYYLVTELTEVVNIVREGNVIAEKPRIVTAGYLINLEGFSDQARRFVQMMAEQSPHEPAVFYRYRNQPRQMDIVSGPVQQAVNNVVSMVESKGDPLAAVIKGVEEFWDVSLIKFTYELTRKSLYSNVAEFQARGLLEVDKAGLPAEARQHIEELFAHARHDPSRVSELARELNQWGVFEEYQDRFFALFGRR